MINTKISSNSSDMIYQSRYTKTDRGSYMLFYGFNPQKKIQQLQVNLTTWDDDNPDNKGDQKIIHIKIPSKDSYMVYKKCLITTST